MTDQIRMYSQETRFFFTVTGSPPDRFAVLDFTGREAISSPYRFEINLASTDLEVDGVLNQEATFIIRGASPEGRVQTYRGIVAEFEQSRLLGEYARYRVILAPRVSNLAISRETEVYVGEGAAEKTIPQLVTLILQNADLSGSFELRIQGDHYRPRSFVCQFEETHFHFISRLMEREGIYYFFEPGAVREIMVITDTVLAHAAPGPPYHYWEKSISDDSFAERAIQTLTMKRGIIPAKVTLKEYNFRRSTLDLTVSAPVGPQGVGEVTLTGENYRTPEEGQKLARIRAEEILCRECLFEGESAALELSAGRLITLAKHYRESFNQDYLVIAVAHQGRQPLTLRTGAELDARPDEAPYYRNAFTMIPSKVQFRPERTTPKPKISGTMTAFIDTEASGEYAELDEYGQYKVQFPFDTTDKPAGKASTRIRLATPYSGQDHGLHFPLLKGTEVLLSFMGGDPDQPVIAATVPNSVNRPLVTDRNPRMNVISTPGGNSLVLGDQDNKQFVSLWSPHHASGVFIGSVESDGGGSLALKTKGNMDQLVYGLNNTITVGGKNTITVGGQTTANAGPIFGFNFTQNTSVNLTDTISWNIGNSYTLGPGKSYNLKPKASFGAIEAITLSGGMMQPTAGVMVASYAALGVAFLAAVLGCTSAAFLGSLFEYDEKTNDPISQGGSKWKIPSGAVAGAVSLIGIIAAEALVRAAGAMYDTAVKGGQVAGVIKLNNDGVNATSYGLNAGINLKTQGPAGVQNTYSKLEMSNSRTAMGNYVSAVGANKSTIFIGANKINLTSQTAAASSSVLLKPAGLKLELKNGGFVNFGAASLNITGPGNPAATVALSATQVQVSGPGNTAQITLNNTKISLKSMGSNFHIDATGFQVG